MHQRKLLSMLFALLFFGSAITLTAADKPGRRYVVASTLTLINKAQPDATGSLSRLDVDRYPALTPTVRTYYGFSTGLAILFRTDSRNISARWTSTDRQPAPNLTGIASKGLDLYIEQDGQWVFAGVGAPKRGSTTHEANLISDMAEGEKLCLLYLPLYDKLSSLELGVDSCATIEAVASPMRHKLIVVGSSITHGISASRPGMAYPARLGRTLGCDVANLGASGQCKLEPFYARIVADSEADLFLFDVFSNPSAEQIRERLIPFVDTIRAAHPDVPLIFFQTEVRETGNFNLTRRDFEARKRAAAEEMMQQLEQRGYRNVYFLDVMDLGTDHEATSDGVHPTDLGFERFLEKMLPQVQAVMQKHGL